MNSPSIHHRRFCLAVLLFAVCSGNIFGDDFGIPRRNRQPAFSALSAPASVFRPPAPVAAPVAPKQASPYKEPEHSVQAPQTESSSPSALTTPSALTAPLPNVVRVIAFDKRGQSLGSGSYIGNYGEYGLILSNWHVIDKTEGLVHIHFPDGFSSYGAVIQADALWDLTLIVISHPPQSVPRLPIAAAPPKQGDTLRIAGYGAGSYRIASGRFVRYLAPEIPKNEAAPLYEIIELSVDARQGDSGGPILNEAGELAGVLFGSDMVQNTAGSCCKRVNLFLSQTQTKLAELPNRPEVYFAAIEPSGPLWQLNETKRIQLRTAERGRQDGGIAGSAGAFGVRSNSQRYVQPAAPASVTVF